MIKIIEDNPEDIDEYQRIIFEFLKKYSINGIFDVENLRKFPKRSVIRDLNNLTANKVLEEKGIF